MESYPEPPPQEKLPTHFELSQTNRTLEFDLANAIFLQGNTAYIDMGILYGNYILSSKNHCIDWDTKTIYLDKAQAIVDKILTKLETANVTYIDLSFAQICDIKLLFHEQNGSSRDTITQIFNGNYQVGDEATEHYKNFLTFFINQAHTHNIHINCSFGGANAKGSDMKFPKGPESSAQYLNDFLVCYDFDSVDFDLEGNGIKELFNQNDPHDVITFFKHLHTVTNMNITLTIAATLNQPNIALLFENSFNEMFDEVNLMTYSNTQYYLSLDNPEWGIKEWSKHIPIDKIHLGFYPKINYSDPKSSAGEPYPSMPKNLNNGQSAAWIFLQLKKDLHDLSSPFFWIKTPTSTKSAEYTFIKDFQSYINQHSPTKKQ